MPVFISGKNIGKFAILCCVLMASPWAAADGYQTCLVEQSDIVLKRGFERPKSAAYDAVCLAILPPTCRDWTVDKIPCAYRSCLVPSDVGRCPNGEPAAYVNKPIDIYVAKELKPFTPAERAAMNRAIDAEAKRLAAQWTNNGRIAFSADLARAANDVACVAVASSSEGRFECVPR